MAKLGTSPSVRDLIIVAGHALRKSARPEKPESDPEWHLQPFQIGEPPFYIEHIRRGVVLAAHSPDSLLLFSGGFTREDAKISEAQSYWDVAEFYNWWPSDEPALSQSVPDRADVEDYARDSFENLLFGICRFWNLLRRYPRNITLVGWAFKEARFNLHRYALKWPRERFHYEGFNDPVNLQAAEIGEMKALRRWSANWYGWGEENAKMRCGRTHRPLSDYKDLYEDLPGLKGFLRFMLEPANATRRYGRRLPWEARRAT